MLALKSAGRPTPFAHTPTLLTRAQPKSSTAGVTCARSPFTTEFSVVSMSLIHRGTSRGGLRPQLNQ